MRTFSRLERRRRTTGSSGGQSPSSAASTAQAAALSASVAKTVLFVGHFFESVYLVMQVSDSNDHKRAMVLQTIFVMNISPSLVPPRTRMLTYSCPRTSTKNHQVNALSRGVLTGSVAGEAPVLFLVTFRILISRDALVKFPISKGEPWFCRSPLP